ncbi:hypothetical protein MNBD_GAMMA21-187 [hydrothermal vent metagenome]|uniref:Fibronectin type-III domain-containing protein n=1 Tax=hydrothermal vent metagenome TaxID=652676 RepID=A0A3B1A1B0_9ZZZZ
MKFIFIRNILSLGLLVSTIAACGGGGGDAVVGGGGGGGGGGNGGDITISWAANREAAVNTMGGGYIVYFSQSSGFNPGDGGVSSLNVPYVSGAAAAPTSAVIPVASSGTWYVRIAAISQLDAPGSTGGSESVASSQTSVNVP